MVVVSFPLRELGSNMLKLFCFAAWGCINASSAGPVIMGHVPGLIQTSDRAELHGPLGALRWQLHHQVDMMLWLDSKYVADGLGYVRAF